jgi:uncharacterized membrane protein YciS (DUF1049 family)
MIRLLILFVLCLFLLTLNLNNSHSLVGLNYCVATRPVPVVWLVSGAFATGIVIGWLFVLPGWIRLKLELRRRKKTQDQLEDEIRLQRKPTTAREFDISTSSPTSSDPDEF